MISLVRRVIPLAPFSLFRFGSLILAVSVLGGCATGPEPTAPSGAAAYDVVPAADPEAIPPEYRIGPRDVLSLKIFREEDFDNDRLNVDANGMVLVPLIGQVDAKGRTAIELAQLIARRLDEKFLVDPQVTVSVVDSASQRLVVDGEVNKAGVFPIRGNSSLLEAMALAGGTSEFAKLDQVIVFRTVAGVPSVARFDLAAIRAGIAPDPALLGNDVVVVGYSAATRRFRDVMQIVPSAAGVFVSLLNNNL